MLNKRSDSKIKMAVLAVGLASSLTISPALSSAVDSKKSANDLVNLGKKEAQGMRHIDAIRHYSQAIKKNPSHHYAYFYRARSRKALNDFQRAVEDYNYVIKLNPKSSMAYNERGWCLSKLDLPKRAIKDYNKAINLDSKNYKAYQNRSSVKYKLGDYQGALSDFNMVLKLKPNSSKDISNFLFPKLNLVKKKSSGSKTTATNQPEKPKKNNDIAISFTAADGKAINISKKELAMINNKAAQAIKSGKFDQAVNILEPITKEHPNYDFARKNLTIAYNNYGLKLARNSTEKSMSKFRSALFYSPSEATARRNLNAVISEIGKNPKSYDDRFAMANELLKNGDYQSAFVEFTEALRLKNTPEVRRKLAEVCLELDSNKKLNSGTVKVASAPPAATPAAQATPAVSATSAAPFASEAQEAPAAPDEKVTQVASDSQDKAEVVPAKPQKTLSLPVAKVETPTTTINTQKQNKNDSSVETASSTSTTPEKTEKKQLVASLPAPQATATGAQTIEEDNLLSLERRENTTPAPKKVHVKTEEEKRRDALRAKLMSMPLPAPAAAHRPVINTAALMPMTPRFSLSKQQILKTWAAHMDFGQKRFDEGDYIGAESSFDSASTLAEGLGAESKELAMSLEKLAEVYLIHKKVSQAYSLLARSLSILTHHLDQSDPKLTHLKTKLDSLSAVINGGSSMQPETDNVDIAAN